MKAIGYTRVSTDKQAREGVSLEVQELRIKQYSELNGIELIEIYSDRGISGKRSDNRPGLIKAIQQAKDNRAVLIVYSLSRLSRTTRDTLRIAEELSAAGGNLASISERIDTVTAAGNMVFRMLAVLAEFEREQIAERTSAAIQHKKSKLLSYGRTPFGYTKRGGKLRANREEQKTIKRIYRESKEGHSLRAIADRLNLNQITGKRGGKWYASSVSYILSNPLYTTA